MLKDCEYQHDERGYQLIPIYYPELREMNPIAARMRLQTRECEECGYVFLFREYPGADWQCESCGQYPDRLGNRTTILAFFIHDPGMKEQ